MPEEIFFLFVFTLGGTVWLLTPVMRALAERLKSRPAGLDATTPDELRRLRDELMDEVGQLRGEVAELGERLDFAERLLAKQQQALPRPGA